MTNITDIICQIADILQRMQDYFLSETNLVLLYDYTFMDEETHQLYFAYMEEYGGNVGKEISKLLEFIMDKMDHQDKDLVFQVYGMHRVCTQENFTLAKLNDCLKRHRPTKPSIPLPPPKEIPMEQKPVQMKEKESVKNVFGFHCLLAGFVGFFLFVAIIKSGLINRPVSGKPDVLKVMVCAIVILLVEAYIFDRERKKNQKNKELMDQVQLGQETTLLVDAFSNDTVVLEQLQEKKLYVNLIPSDWERQEIKIRKTPFFIGKDSTKMDGVVEDSQVSRSHLKIVMEEGRVFVIDQESTNGTYVNSKKLVAWERCEIQSGDRLCIASILYKVEIYS